MLRSFSSHDQLLNEKSVVKKYKSEQQSELFCAQKWKIQFETAHQTALSCRIIHIQHTKESTKGGVFFVVQQVLDYQDFFWT